MYPNVNACKCAMSNRNNGITENVKSGRYLREFIYANFKMLISMLNSVVTCSALLNVPSRLQNINYR